MNVPGVRANGGRAGVNTLDPDDAAILHTALAKDIERRANELLEEKKALWLGEHAAIRDKEIQERAERMLAERRAKILVGVVGAT